jgi:hypothetical protein
MLIRRIVACVCALSLAVPAVAAAKDVRYAGHIHHAIPAVAVGDTKYDLPGSVAPASHDTAATPGQPAEATGDGSNGWRLAAVLEAGVLAAFAIGAYAFVTNGRHRAPHMGV